MFYTRRKRILFFLGREFDSPHLHKITSELSLATIFCESAAKICGLHNNTKKTRTVRVFLISRYYGVVVEPLTLVFGTVT